MAVSAAVKYEVRWRITGTEQWSDIMDCSPVGEIVVEGLDRTKTYDFEVRAVSACGAKSDWGSSSNTVPGSPAPLATTSLTAQSLADGVHLAWTFSSTTPAGVETSIERSPDGTTGWVERSRLRSLSYTDPEPSGTLYYYRVRAVNYGDVYGPYSAVVSSQGIDVAAISSAATAAAAAAAAAQASANSANTELGDIASDNILSPAEKPTVIRDWAVITAEQSGIDAQAISFLGTGSAPQVAYDNAISTLATYLGGLTTATAWNDKSGNTTIVGTTFRTNFNAVYTTRQTLLNAIYAAAQGLANAAQGTANTASTTANTAAGQVAQLPVINGGFDMSPTGYGWAADSGTWFTDTTSISPGVQPNCARRLGSTGTPADTYRNAGRTPVQPNQVVKSQALVQAVGANGVCVVRISWRNASLAEIGVTYGNAVTGTTTAGSYVVGINTFGAVYAVTEIYASAHTAGEYRVDNVVCTQYPSNQSEVPNGGGHNSVTAIDGNGLALIDFTQAGHVSKNVDNIGDGTTYGRPLAARLNAGNPLIDFAAGYHLNKTQDHVGDGALYLRSLPPSGQESTWAIDNAMFQLPMDGTAPAGWQISGAGVTAAIQAASPAPAIAAQYVSVYVPSTGGGLIARKPFSVKPGDLLSLHATINAISGVPSDVHINFFNAAGGYVDVLAVASSSATWQSLTANGVVPTGAATGVLVLAPGNNSYCLYNAVSVTVNDVRVAGSGARIGDQRNLLTRTVANIPAKLPTVISYSYASSTTAPVNVTLSVAAFTMLSGSYSAPYNAMATSISLPAGTTNVFLYFDDPGQAGGTQTLIATTNGNDVYGSDARVNVGGVAVTVTLASTGSGTGGGGGYCPLRTAWVIRRAKSGRPQYIRAANVRVGDFLLLIDGTWGQVTHSQSALVPCVRVVTRGGTLGCSDVAPLKTQAGHVNAIDARGESLLARATMERYDEVVDVIDLGDQWVQHIACQDAFFWAGDSKHYLLAHHNLKP